MLFLKAISSTVEMKDNATGGVIIKYYSKCLNTSAEIENNTNICDEFKVSRKFLLYIISLYCFCNVFIGGSSYRF